MQNSATPITQENSQIARAIRQMTQSVCGVAAAPEKKKKKGFSFFSFSTSGQRRNPPDGASPDRLLICAPEIRPEVRLPPKMLLAKHPLRYHCVYKGMRPDSPWRPAQVVCVSRFFQRTVFVLSVAIFAALGLGFAMGEFGLFGVHAGTDQDGAYRQMRVYAEVLQKIQSDYVTDPNMGDVTTGALHGLA